MFRVFLLLATAATVLVITGVPAGLFRAEHAGGRLVTSFTDSPTVTVTSAPTTLDIGQPGSIEVRAGAPAAPGDTIILDTAGALGLGYNQVSQGVLDANLQASLTVAGRDYAGTYNYWARVPATGRYQEGKSATFAIVIAHPAPPAPPADLSCGGATPHKADGTAWQCTFDDEFDAGSLDRRFWVPLTGGTTTGTTSTYACAVDSPDTINVAGGYLALSLVQLPAARQCSWNQSSPYAYGQVMHYGTFSQTYGKYEIRAKVPDLSVPGAQESFWLWPRDNSYGGWPASGEIDFAELYSALPTLDRPYLHYLPGTTAGGTNQNVTTADCAINVGQFNTYGVEWKPQQITVLLNGQICFTDDYSSIAAALQGKTSPFDKPFYLAMNQAMGTVGNSYDPTVVPRKVTTQIDYVRIWK